MGKFTDLKHNQLARLAEEFSLGALHGFRAIAAGTINSNFQIDTDRGRFFLRVNEGKNEDEVAYEVAVLSHLVAGGVSTPLPLVARTGLRYASFEQQYVSVFPWQGGHHAETGSISEDECRAVGRTLALLHHAGRDMRDLHDGRYTFEHVVGAYEKFSGSNDPDLALAIAVIGNEISWLRGRDEMRAALPNGLIHADLFPDNVLMHDGEVVALLDFEQACSGAYCYDLAVCLNAWCFADAFVLERAAALLGGYREIRELEVCEIEGLETELRASALRFTVTRIRDVYLPAAGAQITGKDFRRFLMRLQTWQGMGPRRIADLATAAPLA